MDKSDESPPLRSVLSAFDRFEESRDIAGLQGDVSGAMTAIEGNVGTEITEFLLRAEGQIDMLRFTAEPDEQLKQVRLIRGELEALL